MAAASCCWIASWGQGRVDVRIERVYFQEYSILESKPVGRLRLTELEGWPVNVKFLENTWTLVVGAKLRAIVFQETVNHLKEN